MNKNRSKFPNNFFRQPRKECSIKEALKDVVPVKWSKEVEEGKRKVLLQKKKTIN